MKKVTVKCSVTIQLNLDEGESVASVLQDLDCQINRGELTSYDVEDAIVHLNEAEVTYSR
jgi:hypothetical protein